MTTNEQIQKQNEAACVSVAIHERDEMEIQAEVQALIDALNQKAAL